MHAFLFVGQESFLDPKIKEKVVSLGARLLEFPLAKVSDVRELGGFTKLKVSEKTVILIKDFDKATVEAQNAFLKALEEPQENLSYILTAHDIDEVLATIASRCEVTEIGGEYRVEGEEKKKAEKFINYKVGEKLQVISYITKREEAIGFLENVIVVGHENMVKNSEEYQLVDEAVKTLKNLEANGNVSLQLTNFVVNG